MSATSSQIQTAYSASTSTNTGSAALFLDHLPSTGPQWMVIASWVYSELNIFRGYLDGDDTTAVSSGKTSSEGLGFMGRFGWN